jgi:vancomycin permeability regulator SanA
MQVFREFIGKTGFARNALPRGFALFLGGFTLLNCMGGMVSHTFDANLWWIDLRAFPTPLATLFLLVAGICLIGCGLRPARSSVLRILVAGCLALLCAASLVETLTYYRLMILGTIHAGIPVPLSLVFAGMLVLIIANNFEHADRRTNQKAFLQMAGVALACLVGFPLAQIFFFGKTDYRRDADVAVVLGARVYADGRPSDALADRVRTACKLYQDGLVRTLVFSGGPGPGILDETDSMRAMARRLGVKDSDMVCDKGGVNTQATVNNTQAILARLHARRVLVVSHFYHLPRVKLAYQRAGWDVYTVPAKEERLLRQYPYNIAREVAALWVYYLRPLA